MYETLKMMNQILLGNEGKKSVNDLIDEYKEYKSPNILAYFYSSNFGLINNISRLYPKLNSSDKASFCLQELDNCLLNYDYNRDAKFTTYFSKCLKNRLQTEVGLLYTHKRKIIFSLNDIDDCKENLINFFDDSAFSYSEFKNTYNLTEFEFEQCKLLNVGYSLREISSILNKSLIYIYITHSKIKEKILKNSITFT